MQYTKLKFDRVFSTATSTNTLTTWPSSVPPPRLHFPQGQPSCHYWIRQGKAWMSGLATCSLSSCRNHAQKASNQNDNQSNWFVKQNTKNKIGAILGPCLYLHWIWLHLHLAGGSACAPGVLCGAAAGCCHRALVLQRAVSAITSGTAQVGTPTSPSCAAAYSAFEHSPLLLALLKGIEQHCTPCSAAGNSHLRP